MKISDQKAQDHEFASLSMFMDVFNVDATSDTSINMLRLATSAARGIQTHQAAGTVPERTRCARDDCTRAKACPVATTCFNLPADAGPLRRAT